MKCLCNVKKTFKWLTKKSELKEKSELYIMHAQMHTQIYTAINKTCTINFDYNANVTGPLGLI